MKVDFDQEDRKVFVAFLAAKAAICSGDQQLIDDLDVALGELLARQEAKLNGFRQSLPNLDIKAKLDEEPNLVKMAKAVAQGALKMGGESEAELRMLLHEFANTELARIAAIQAGR